MKNKIYISGPVSDTSDYIERFYKTEKQLRETFNGEVFNPVRHIHATFKKPEELEWKFIMMILLEELIYNNYTHIFMMKDFLFSSGAVIEHEYAKKLGMVIIYDSNN